MAYRIEVGFKEGIRDALGEKIKMRIIVNLSLSVEKVSTIEVYTIAGDLTKDELKEELKHSEGNPHIKARQRRRRPRMARAESSAGVLPHLRRH